MSFLSFPEPTALLPVAIFKEHLPVRLTMMLGVTEIGAFSAYEMSCVKTAGR
jgi:hypothetical protein